MADKQVARKRTQQTNPSKDAPPNMPSGSDNGASSATLEAKVASHDRDISNLTSSIQSLSDTLQSTADSQWNAIREQGEVLRAAIHEQGSETRKDLNVLGSKFSESRAVNWPLIVTAGAAFIGFAGVTITLMALLGSMSLGPLKESFKEHMANGHPHSVEKKIAELEVRTTEHFRGLGEQLRSAQVENNLLHQQSLIVLNLTRKEAGLTPLDLPQFWPSRSSNGSE